VAATKFIGDCKFFVGNKPAALGPHYAAKPITISPGDIIGMCGGNVGTEVFDLLKSGGATLDVYILADYEGPGGRRYKYCDKQRYAPEFNKFANMGECDESKPFPQ
jgi:hypothetical protein